MCTRIGGKEPHSCNKLQTLTLAFSHAKESVNAYIYCPLRSKSTHSRNRKGSGDEANTPPKRSSHGSQDSTPKVYDMENQLPFPSFKKDIDNADDGSGDFDDAKTNDTWRDKVSIIIGFSIINCMLQIIYKFVL